VKWLPCHPGPASPQDADGANVPMDMNDAGSVGDGPPIWGLDMGYRPPTIKTSSL
jgi:hypothetical protein